MPEIGHSSSSLGANAGSRGRRLVRWYSLTWPLCPHAVRGDLPQGASIASQGPHVDENRPISGRLGRSFVHSFVRAVVRLLLRSASVTLSVVCWTWHPAAKVRGETV